MILPTSLNPKPQTLNPKPAIPGALGELDESWGRSLRRAEGSRMSFRECEDGEAVDDRGVDIKEAVDDRGVDIKEA